MGCSAKMFSTQYLNDGAVTQPFAVDIVSVRGGRSTRLATLMYFPGYKMNGGTFQKKKIKQWTGAK